MHIIIIISWRCGKAIWPTVAKKVPRAEKYIHMTKRRHCSREGCANRARGEGICIAHGAKVKRCSQVGCTNQVIKQGVCIAHGAIRKRCSREGCTNQVTKQGVCKAHGAVVKRCSREGCTRVVHKGGVCWAHDATVKRCNREGCTNHAVRGGVCKAHGAKVKRCSLEGCTILDREGGTCWSHSDKGRCSHEDCRSFARKGGLCRAHGAVGERKKHQCCRGGFSDGLNGKKIAKSHAAAATGENDEHLRSSGGREATATPARAIAGVGESDGAVKARRSPLFHLDFSDDEDEVNAWIWRTSRMSRLVGGATINI
jgi:hypothetical protein